VPEPYIDRGCTSLGIRRYHGPMPIQVVRRADRETLLSSLALMSEGLGFGFGRHGLTEDIFLDLERPESFRVAVDPEARRRVQGVLTFQLAGQWYGGRSVPMAGVRCVAVAPEARGRGVLRTLLTDTLSELRAEGIALSALYPSSPRVYRSFGYEHAGQNLVRRLPIAELPDPGPAPLTTELVPATEVGRLHEIYTRVAARHDGWIDRVAWWWPRALEKPYAPSKPRVYAFVRGDRVEGYASLVHVTGEGPYRLHVSELVLDSGDAARSALTLLHAHRSMFPSLSWNAGAVDLLSLFVPVPVGDVEDAGVPLPHPINPWMLRLVEPKAALEARGYGVGIDAELHLQLEDRTLPENSGPYRVRVVDGRAEVERGGHGTLRLDTRALASLYAGHHGVHALSLAGLLEGGDERARALLQTIFPSRAAWMWDPF
jgi:predicted acetyltransferase